MQWAIGGPIDMGFTSFGAATPAQLSGLKDQLLTRIGERAAVGVRSTSLPTLPAASVEEFCDSVAWLGAEVLPAGRSL